VAQEESCEEIIAYYDRCINLIKGDPNTQILENTIDGRLDEILRKQEIMKPLSDRSGPRGTPPRTTPYTTVEGVECQLLKEMDF